MDSWSSGPPADLARPAVLPVPDALRLVVEGVALVLGSPSVTVAVARDDGRLHVLAVAGDDTDPSTSDLEPVPVEPLLRELEEAPAGGPFLRVPRSDRSRLVAPLRDEHGTVRGALSAYLPDPASEPGPRELRLLESYADQAARAVVASAAGRQHTDQARMADAVRQVVREASAHRSLQHVLAASQPALVEGLGARGMWIQTFDEDGLGRGSVYSTDGRPVEFTETVYAIAYNAAHLLWERQDTLILSRRRHTRLLTPAESRDVADFLEALELDSILFVPVGAGLQCLGNLVLSREAGQPEWDADEADAALEIGRDLGVAVASVRSYERERRLVREVQALEARLNRLVGGGDDPAGFDPGGRDIERELGSVDPDLARTRAELRSAGDTLEQTGRQRDAQARILADALATGQATPTESVEAYRRLRAAYRDAHLYWQVAFDAWQEVSEADAG